MAKRGKTGTKRKRRIFPPWFVAGLILAPVMGVVVFNIDRLEYVGERRHVLKQYLPRWMKAFLPENTATLAVLPPGSEIKGRVVEVYDGDTVTVLSLDEKTKYRLRLYGIDAPESDQEFGDEARLALHQLVYGKIVEIEVIDNDIYQRSVAKLYCDNVYVNLKMVATGNAYCYVNYARHDLELPRAEAQAKERGLGVWSKRGLTPPWEHRKNLKKEE